MKKIFIDGSAGTTGLRIYERLENRSDIKLITLTEEDRKNSISRKKAINDSDVTFLCLPDEASKESVSFVENPNTVILDTSTAHRTNENWLYGFPEVVNDFSEKVKTAKRIAVPGCHASGFIALIKPLIDNGVISKDVLLACTSVTGYSGGGKKMIADYENEDLDLLLQYPRQYGLTQTHKHLKEMCALAGLTNSPAFSPIVAPFYSGMEVTIPIFNQYLINGATKQTIEEIYAKTFNSKVVYFTNESENGFISSGKLSGKDSMEVSVFGNEERILLCARYDNLGKGASGAAVQCLNYCLGVDETTGLDL